MTTLHPGSMIEFPLDGAPVRMRVLECDGGRVVLEADGVRWAVPERMLDAARKFLKLDNRIKERNIL